VLFFGARHLFPTQNKEMDQQMTFYDELFVAYNDALSAIQDAVKVSSNTVCFD
jgi:hypothetical protein